MSDLSSGRILRKELKCDRCKKTTTAIFHMKIARNGAESFCWQCSVPGCGAISKNPANRGIWIPKEEVQRFLSPEEIEALPRIVESPSERCVVCGDRNTEYHHWAPRAMFPNGEAENWPKDWLCKKCHDRWHAIVTPQLVKP